MSAGGVSWRNKIAAPNESSTSISHQVFQIEFRTQRGLEPPVVLGIRDEGIWIRYKCKNGHNHLD